MYDWITANGLKAIVIATKADKINRSQLQKQLSMIRKELHMKADESLIPWSAETRQGFDEVWNIMDTILNPQEEVQV